MGPSRPPRAEKPGRRRTSHVVLPTSTELADGLGLESCPGSAQSRDPCRTYAPEESGSSAGSIEPLDAPHLCQSGDAAAMPCGHPGTARGPEDDPCQPREPAA